MHTRQLREERWPGGGIWVNIPGQGYAGVGIVKQSSVPAGQFKIKNEDGQLIPITGAPLAGKFYASPDTEEHLVRVEWIKTVPVNEAIREKGFFGNQNSAAKPRANKWVHTVERLKTRFGVDA